MSSQTPPPEPIVPAYHIRILSDDQLEQFKSSTFEILETPESTAPQSGRKKFMQNMAPRSILRPRLLSFHQI